MNEMLPRGPARKVTIYLNEDTQAPHGPLHQAILQFPIGKSVAGVEEMLETGFITISDVNARRITKN